jgi:tagatose 1,6-diphosphate aldolase
MTSTTKQATRPSTRPPINPPTNPPANPPTKLSAGKYWGLRRLADDNGRWKMVAIDQRGPLMIPIAAKRGLPDAPYDDVAAVKAAVTQVLAPHASAMLLDPNFAYPRCVEHVPARVGLCLTLEHHVTDDSAGARRSREIPDWSVAKIRRIGADAVKLLVWYRPDAPKAVLEHQQALVRRVGAQCRAHDIVFLLELLVYPLAGESAQQLAAARPQLVLDSMRDFAEPGYGVDIYKLEPPAIISAVPDPHGAAAAAVQSCYDRLGALTTRPWVLLSAGAAAADFQRSLTYAYRAGASGYLCGRAIWHSSFEQFPDMNAMRTMLAQQAVPYLARINELTDRLATPWFAHAGVGGRVALGGDGPAFATGYAAGYATGYATGLADQ